MTRFIRTFALLVLLAPPAHAQSTSTFTLDAGSYVSFADEEIVLIPSGSIVFQLGEPLAEGTIPFTITPVGVSIAEILTPDGETTLRYSLAAPASGTIVPTPDGGLIHFTAAVNATLSSDSGALGTIRHTMPFTTETATASNAGGQGVEISGIRLVPGDGYAQIVVATVNPPHAAPGPGAPVYAVLSGRFEPEP